MARANYTITNVLADIRAGRASTTDLLPLVYEDLRKQASSLLRRRRAGHTLQTTVLVHDVAIRLLGQAKPDWQDRIHFFAAAAQAMSQILADYARRKGASKRGGSWKRVALQDGANPSNSDNIDLLALHEALQKLGEMDQRMGRVVECRFFTGMKMEEIAQVLSVSISTVESDWSTARAWLSRELRKGGTT
ncbi:MAG: ECF-type sigma factor [Phycisphaerales bacterium]|nr:ECF-type sigma factor [Phycisphaerales bacterium]